MADSNLALLIDGDNVSPKIIAGLLAEITNYGTASVKRIYGDWTTPSLAGWKACLLSHSITPIQQFAYTTGKNATDGAMIIDAMDLLYTGRFSSFCIVSSDSDFTRLASRIREQGVTVYGFGERKTNNAFIAACDKFTYFDALISGSEPAVTIPQTAYTSKSSAAPTFPPAQSSQRRPIDNQARDGIIVAIRNAMGYGDFDGWVKLALVGNLVSKLSSNLHHRNYGYEKLLDFVAATGVVEVRFDQIDNKPPLCLVRLKEDDTEVYR